MGSILNFVFPYQKENMLDWFIPGPLTCHIEQNLKHTHNLDLDTDCKNVIVFETVNKFKGFIENINYKIKNEITILDFLKNNSNLDLILCSIADPATTHEKQELLKSVELLNIKNKIYFIESNFQHKDDDNTFCWHFFIEDFAVDTKQIYLGEKNQLGYKCERIEEGEIDKFRNKKFLCFNRTIDRPHRISLLYDYLNNDFSDSLFSFLVYYSEYKSIYQFNPNDFDTNYFHQFLPIELDTQDTEEKKNFVTGDAIGKKDFYLDSCIHLVTETSFHQNELFLSEKILKPILNFQPFIVFGPQYYLKELKRIGFKTFSDFWNEDYDNIEDGKDRYFKIMELVLSLNSKSIDELNEIYKKTKEICIHNKNHFDNVKFTINDFLKNLENK